MTGVDDRTTECMRVQPPLSSISTERFRAGQEAARALDELLTRTGSRAAVRRVRPST